jgi:hypothetical protein
MTEEEDEFDREIARDSEQEPATDSEMEVIHQFGRLRCTLENLRQDLRAISDFNGFLSEAIQSLMSIAMDTREDVAGLKRTLARSGEPQSDEHGISPAAFRKVLNQGYAILKQVEEREAGRG